MRKVGREREGGEGASNAKCATVTAGIPVVAVAGKLRKNNKRPWHRTRGKRLFNKVIITGGRWSKESRTKCGTRNSGCQPARCIIKCWLSRVRRGVEIARTGLRVRARDPDNTHRGGGESRGGKAKKKRRRKKVEKESCCTNSRVAHSQRLA